MHAAPFQSPVEIRNFLGAGKAILTLHSLKTDTHRTFRVRASDRENQFFVDLLTGPSNTNDYRYLGFLVLPENGFPVFKGNKQQWGTDAQRVFRWFLDRVISKSRMPEQLEVWHEGRCGRCGRALTVPESIASGLGPVCAGRGQ